MPAETYDHLRARYGEPYRWFLTVGGMLASFTMVFSGTIVNVAVPDVMGAYGVGQDKAQLLSTAYIATMTASQLLNTWFVATFGQRYAFCILLVVFTIGGLICSVSQTLDLIIFGRVVQGFASGIVQPLVMVTLFQIFPKERRGTAMGIYGMGLVFALGLGPVIGGITVDTLGWRAIFYVPAPLVVIAFAMGMVFMPSSREAGPRTPFDWTSYGLLCIALYCLISGISNGQRMGWASDEIALRIVIGIAAAAGFTRMQLRDGPRLLDFTLFRNAKFASAIVVAFVFGMGNFAMTYAVPVFGQIVQGYTATVAGFLLLPASLILMVVFPLTGRLADRVPPQLPVMGGLVVFAVGVYLMSGADVNTVFWSFAFFAIISRVGMGFINPPLMAAALGALPPERLSQGSGTINFFRQLGGACGINLLVVILEMRTQFHSDTLTATQTAGNATTRELLGQVKNILQAEGIPEAMQDSLAYDYLGKVIEAQANTFGFQDGFLITAGVFICALIPAWILGRARPSP
ncbi:MAG: DHA2 family efflux MFS transporter permease subunit [Alphaproteobacteria bacterium]|nr:DHA2 family efflux MFS transporter permease subunit [Alphaproteobacteria bacterium]